MKQVLCYGDSNTHGYDALTGGRYDWRQRWTGLLEERLGGAVRICEEGLNGRTCGFDDPEAPGRNGKTYFPCALQTHKPLDAVVLMLGTNDCKDCFRAESEQITRQLERLLEITAAFSALEEPAPVVLVVAPHPLDEACIGCYGFSARSVRVSRALADSYRRAAKKWNAVFVDAAEWNLSLDFDGVHLTAEDHQRVAQQLEAVLRALLHLSAIPDASECV